MICALCLCTYTCMALHRIKAVCVRAVETQAAYCMHMCLDIRLYMYVCIYGSLYIKILSLYWYYM